VQESDVSYTSIPPSAAEIVSLNPTTGEELGRVSSCSRVAADAAIEKARWAFAGWSAQSLQQRGEFLRRLSDVILRGQEDIARLIAEEQGKPLTEALAAEVLSTLAILKYLRRSGPKILSDRRVGNDLLLFTHKKSRYRMVPFGVVAVISPWNFPFSVPVPQIAAALMAGNTIVFKPAPAAVLIGEKIDELFRQAGFPDGVVNFLPMLDADAPHLTSHTGIDKIIFTGSTAVGKQVMCAASQNVKSLILELGGKDPAIVAADADLPRAAKGIVWGSLFSSGQVCASIERVYVEKTIAEKFISLCLDEIRRVRVGDPLQIDTDLGPMTTRAQLEKVEDQIADARALGAQVLYGGERLQRPGFFLQPALITGVHHGMKIMREETFGPVIAIQTVEAIDEAIRLANDCTYGLSAYGWTRSRKTAERLMNELAAGTVMINDATSSWGEPSAPWVGFKQSGIGLTRSPYGLVEMAQIKYVSYDSGRNRRNPWWYPYTAASRSMFTHASGFLYDASMVKKVRSLMPLLGNRLFLTTTRWWSVIRNLHKAF